MGWVESIAENIWFVLPSYIFALGLSSLAISHDFVSKRWMTVKETRKRGKVHAVVIVISLIIMTFYVAVQFMKGDFKEMSTGFIALCFSLLHLVRTFLGLWQLHCFKEWAASSLKSVDSMQVNEIINKKRGSKSEDGSKIQCADGITDESGMETLEVESKDYYRIQADDIMVNDSVVENRILEGDVRCSIKWWRSNDKMIRKIWDSLVALKNLFQLSLLLLFDIGNKSSFVSSNNVPYLKLKQPHDVWIRWATVFIAKFHGKGRELVHGEEYRDKEQKTNSVLDKFRQELLLYCALHTTDTDAGNISFPYEYWSSSSSFENLSNGFFSKSEFLKKAQNTGRGLPFAQGHSENNYSAYKTKLDIYKSELHVDVIENVNNLQIEDIEWLLVVVSIENWGFKPKAQQNNKKSVRSKLLKCWEEIKDECKSLSNSVLKMIRNSEDYVETVPKKSDLENVDKFEELRIHPIVQNLMEQIGVCGDFDLLLRDRNFPKVFKRISMWKTYYENDNILQMSYHLDNWISLSAGLYVDEFLSKHKEKSNNRAHEEFCRKFLYQRTTPEELSKIFTSNYALEQNVKTYLLVRSASQSMSSSLCFLGCGIEGLRSFLADKRNEIDNWNPNLKDVMNKSSKLPISYGLKIALVRGNLSFALKMRLLWETQNALLSNLEDKTTSNSCFVQNTICLCILYFPAINLSMSNSNNCSAQKREGLTAIEFKSSDYEVIPILAPQDLYISISLEEEQFISVSLRSVGKIEPVKFFWEAWRNVFYGRFHGSQIWHNKFKLNSNSRYSNTFSYHENPISSNSLSKVSSKLSDILSGENFIELWTSWMPYKPNICKFELKLYLHKKEKNKIQYSEIKLDDSEVRNLDMECLHEAISCYEENSSREVGGYSASKRRLILRTRAEALKTQGKYRSAALLFFLSATSFCDIESLECCINLLNKHATSDWNEIGRLVIVFQEKQNSSFFENDPRCLRFIGVLRKIMVSTRYNLISTKLFCDAALRFQSDNVQKKRSLEKESFDSLVISLRFHFDHWSKNDFSRTSSAMKLLQESLTNSDSSQENKLFSTILKEETVPNM